MAASTANMVQSSSGKMYDASSSQGKMIRSKGGTQEVGNDKASIFERILETLKSNNSLLFQIDDNTEESEGEKRNRRIKGANLDPKEKGPGIMSKIGSGLKATGGALQKMNPFSEGIGTKMGILLLTGLLFAITKFGDKLVKPLANLLEMIDKDGGMLDKFKDTALFKAAAETFEKIKKRAMEIDEDIKKLLAAVTKVVNTIKNAYKAVEDYILQFDKDGDGSLDEDERKELFKSIKTKAVDAISGFFGDVMMSIGGMLLSATFIGKTAGLAFAAVKPIFAGLKTGATLSAAAGAVSTGAMLLPIAGMLLYGVTTTWSNISNSIKDTIEEEGSFSFSGFFANFFGGDDKGGFMNAMRQAFKLGGTFALVGMTIGAIAGAGILSIPGALIGGLIGMGVGLLVGSITGALGSDRIKKFTKGLGDMVANVIDTIGDFFGNVIAGFKSFFAGEGFGKGYNDARYANKSEAESDLLDIQDEIAALEAERAAFKAKSPDAVFFNQRKLDKKKAEAADLELTIKDAPQHAINRNRRLLEESQEKGAERIEALEKSKAYSPSLFIQGGKKTALQNELEELYESQREGSIALQRMPANKDTLRTTLIKDEQKLKDLKNEELRAKNAELNKKFDSVPLGASAGFTNINVENGTKLTGSNTTLYPAALGTNDGYGSSGMGDNDIIKLSF